MNIWVVSEGPSSLQGRSACTMSIQKNFFAADVLSTCKVAVYSFETLANAIGGSTCKPLFGFTNHQLNKQLKHWQILIGLKHRSACTQGDGNERSDRSDGLDGEVAFHESGQLHCQKACQYGRAAFSLTGCRVKQAPRMRFSGVKPTTLRRRRGICWWMTESEIQDTIDCGRCDNGGSKGTKRKDSKRRGPQWHKHEWRGLADHDIFRCRGHISFPDALYSFR